MNVYLTFDVEVWCGGWNNLDDKFPTQFDRYVYGRSAAGEFALPKTLEMLNAHGLKGVFFTEPLFAARFGVEHLETIVRLIRQAGQDVQLHLHPEWSDELKPPVLPNHTSKRQHLHYYSLAEQTALISAGKSLIEQAGGGRVTAFRSGSFACNRDTFRALGANDIWIDSSLNGHYAVSGHDLQGEADFVAPSVIEGVASHPVATFRDGFGRRRPAQISGCSASEMRQAMLSALRQGRSEFIVVSHNFEMLQPGRSDPDPIVVRRFADLCRFLGENRHEMPTQTFSLSDAKPSGAHKASAAPRTGLTATLRRYAEQVTQRLQGVTMDRSFSIYLDLVRFGAACLVYLYHSNQRALTSEILPASNFGHSSVIVFFVLSGFVIAYVTDKKERTWTSYSASRLSRVYSVALPALVLTVLLDSVGRGLMPSLYGGYPYDRFAERLGAGFLMLNEWWFVSVTSFSNVPYWSIGYEFWYYALFGIYVFLPSRLAWPVIVILALFLGPKVILLAPIWAAGVALYRWKALQRMPVGWASVVCLLSIAGIVGFHMLELEPLVTSWFKSLLGPELHTQLTFSKFFMTDYLLGALVFVNFASMRVVAPYLSGLFLAIERPVRYVAAYTFTLYLLHQPLFLFWAAVLRGDPRGSLYWWQTTGLVMVSVLAIGYVTENKRHALRRWLEQVFARAPTLFARRA